VVRLDYVSCVLTVTSTILVGRGYWQGWLLGAMNGVIMCVIGFKTAQLGFIPANLFCMALSANNLLDWRKAAAASLKRVPESTEVRITTPQLTPQ
jgi:nicotinamide riboside transporter PnuC